MCDAALFLVSLGALASGQAAVGEDVSDLAYQHFRERYELYSTIGDFDAAEFRELTQLSLAGTEFNDDDVPHLAGLVSLRKLDLSGTQITDKGLEALGQLDIPLKVLLLARTKITDVGLIRLAFLETLTDLDLTETGVTSKGIVQLPRFKGRLESLALGRGVTDAGLKTVPAMNGLRELRLPVDSLSPASFAVIARSETLRSLELYGERLRPEMLRHVTGMSNLERLVLSGFESLGDEDLKDLPMMASLRFLDVSRTGITNRALRHIAKVPRIEGLALSFTGVTDAGMKSLGDMVWSEEGEDFALRTATNITHLELASTAITDRGLDHLSALQLTSLDISRTQVTNECHELLASWKLKTLVAEGRMALTDLSVVDRLPELECLDVSDRKGINAQLRNLDRHPSLRVLDVSNTDIIDSSMMPVTRLESLRQLNIAGTRISLETLKTLAKLRRIELVNVFGTNILVHGEERRAALPGMKLSRLRAFPAFPD